MTAVPAAVAAFYREWNDLPGFAMAGMTTLVSAASATAAAAAGLALEAPRGAVRTRRRGQDLIGQPNDE